MVDEQVTEVDANDEHDSDESGDDWPLTPKTKELNSTSSSEVLNGLSIVL